MSNKRGKVVRTERQILYIWIGIVLSLVTAGIWISNTGNLKGIGGTGQVLDLSYWQLSKSNSSIQYDRAADQYEILCDSASVKLKINRNDKKWNYLSVDIGSMSCPVLEGTLIFYDEEKKIIAEQRMELKQGHSLLALENVKFSSLKLRIEGQKGATLKDVSVQFREETEFFSGKRYLVRFCVCFGIYVVCISAIIAFVKRIKCTAGLPKATQGLAVLQKKYSIYIDLFGKKIAVYLSDRWRRNLRVGCFAILAGYLIVIHNRGTKYVQTNYGLHMVVILGMIFLIICLCWEKTLQAVKWNRKIFISWSLLAIWMVCSDFFITKECMWTGVFLLLFFGMFYFVWGNMNNPEQLLEDLCTAWDLVFWMGMLYSVLFRKIETGYLYSGFFTDSNTFALFLVIMLEIGIGRILEGKRTAISGIEIGVSFIMIWKTQEIFAFGTVLISLIAGLVVLIAGLRRKADRKCMAGVICAIAAGIFVWLLCEYVRSPLLGDVIFTQDVHREAEAGNLLALLRENNWKYFFYTKLMIWKQYIRGWNLYGHAANAVYNGEKVLPYNGFLLMAYKYGIVALIPYGVMIVEGFRVCIRKIREKQAGYCICLFSGIGYVLLNLIQNVEVPYVGLNWLWMALVFGYCFKERDMRGARR